MQSPSHVQSPRRNPRLPIINLDAQLNASPAAKNRNTVATRPPTIPSIPTDVMIPTGPKDTGPPKRHPIDQKKFTFNTASRPYVPRNHPSLPPQDQRMPGLFPPLQAATHDNYAIRNHCQSTREMRCLYEPILGATTQSQIHIHVAARCVHEEQRYVGAPRTCVTFKLELRGMAVSVCGWLSHCAFFRSQCSRVHACYCEHGTWWAIAYTTRIVLSAGKGTVECTRRTVVCIARITTIWVWSQARPICAHARANRICADHVCCQPRADARLPKKMQARYSRGARLGVMSGFP